MVADSLEPSRATLALPLAAALAAGGCGPHYDKAEIERFLKPLITGIPALVKRVEAAEARALRRPPVAEREGADDGAQRVRALRPQPAMQRRRGGVFNTEWLALESMTRPNQLSHLRSPAQNLVIEGNLHFAIGWTLSWGGEVAEASETLSLASKLRYAIVIHYVRRLAKAGHADQLTPFGGRVAATLVTLPAGKPVATTLVAIPADADASDAATLLVKWVGKRWGLTLSTDGAWTPRRGLSKRAETYLAAALVGLVGIVLPLGVIAWFNRRRKTR